MKTENTIKKLGQSAKKAKAAKTRNSFRRALYRANKIIDSGNSYRNKNNKFSMKEFKSNYTDFSKQTNLIKGKNLDKDLKTFVDYYVNKRTPDQCKAAADNLKRHLNNAVRSLNRSKGGIETTVDTNQRYIQVLIEAGALRTGKNKDGKTVYSILWEKVPNKEDFINVSDKYLRWKRLIVKYFGDKEYSEAYGS